MCSEYLCTLGEEYLNALTCKCYAFSRQNSATFDTSHVFVIDVYIYDLQIVKVIILGFSRLTAQTTQTDAGM